MVAKISMGSSLYGALAYNGEKINEARGKLLATNKIYNDGTGTVDIGRALNDFLLYMPSQTRVEKPVVGGETGGAYIAQSAPGGQAHGYGLAEHRKGISGEARFRGAALYGI